VDYYASLRPPYRPRNGPFETVRELLMVRGITPSLLGDSTSGLASIFTVESSVQNVGADGETRVNVQTADERALTGVSGITADMARAIIAYRGQNRLNSLADLLDVTPAQGNRPGGGPNQGGRGGSPQNPQSGPSNPSGPRLISQQLLMDIGDAVTADQGQEQVGLVNINTASATVLAMLPGVDLDLAQAIISYRQSSGYFPNVMWLLKVPGITPQMLKQLGPRVTARSETYRILCEGKVPSSGSRQRIEAIVHVGLNSVELRGYREDDL
jgi:competence ComEA-like helix-hairpin-helix protein